MPNTAAYIAANAEKTAAYMHAYYLTHDGADRQRVTTLGASRDSKKCKKCGVLKSRAEFTIRQTGSRVGHLAAYCKSCSSIRATIAAKKDSTLYRRVQWPSKLKRLYGITVADYHRMLAEQGGGCALCHSQTPLVGNRKYMKNGKETLRSVFDVDHNHKTGKVRGLLCTRCNRLVGLANDDVNTARRLVAYLSREEN